MPNTERHKIIVRTTPKGDKAEDGSAVAEGNTLLLIDKFTCWVGKLSSTARAGLTVGIIGLAAAYIASPLDFDFIPIAGWIDDGTLAFVAGSLSLFAATNNKIFVQPLRLLEASLVLASKKK